MASLQPLIINAGVPVDLVAERGLADGGYIISNGGLSAVILFEGGAQAPAHREGHPVPPRGTWSFTVAGAPIWAWTATDATVMISEG